MTDNPTDTPHLASDYRVVTVPATGPIGTDFAAACEALSAQVRAAIGEGWQPQGGIAVAHPVGGAQPTVMQAMIRCALSPRRDSGAVV